MAEPLNATFFAFRKREQSGVLLRTSLAFLIAAAVLVVAFIGVNFASLAPALSWYSQVLGAAASNDTGSIESMGLPTGLGILALTGLVWTFFFALLYASFEAACLRWMVRGETGGFMGLTLGADTWRVYSGYWLWFLLYMGFSMAMGIVVITIVGVLTVASSGDPAAMTSGMIAGYVLQYATLAYFATRFAPAAATSIARRKFSFFDAWKVTKGRFWALFGAFFVLMLINFVFGIIIAGVWFVSVLGAAAPDWSSVRDFESFNRVYIEIVQAYIQSFTQPATWLVVAVLQVLSALFGLFIYVAMFGVNARAAQAALEEGKITPVS
jgi:hypothetical protein